MFSSSVHFLKTGVAAAGAGCAPSDKDAERAMVGFLTNGQAHQCERRSSASAVSYEQSSRN